MSNRAAITIRLNLEEQAAMRDLMEGYKRAPKDLLKMGFYLLIETTKKIRQEQAAAEAAKGEADLIKPNTSEEAV